MLILPKIRNLLAGTHCQDRHTTPLWSWLWSFFLLALLLVCPLSAQAQTRSVSGTITLEDCATFPQSVHLKFWPTAGGDTVTQSVTLASNGSFTVNGLAATTYILTVKGAKWLRKNTNVNTTSGNVTGVSLTLLAGDGNNDNSVDVLDLDLLMASYDLCENDTGYDPQADFNCDTCADILDLDILLRNFDLVGDEDPVPPIVNFNITDTEVFGGADIEITFNLADPPPSGGALVTLTCAPNASVQTENVTVTDTDTVTLHFKTSTTNHLTTAAVLASYSGTTVKDTVRLKPVHLRVTGIRPGRVRLEWSSYTAPYGFVIKRFNGLENGVATTAATYHHDDFTFTTDTDYTYELYAATQQGAAGTLLATEKVKIKKATAEANQTVDSRIDRRYAVDTPVDFAFGTRTYRGGLFAGLAADESRIGRSFARYPFPSNVLDATSALRCGIANAYFMGLHRKNKSSGSYSPVDIYCQSLHTTGIDSLDMSTLVWTGSPALTLPATDVFSRATVAMSGSGYVLPGEWAMWDVSQGVLDSLRGDLKLTVAWTGASDSATGWAYFAKKEYDADLGPVLYYALTYPTPVGLSFWNSSNTEVSTVVSGTPVTVHVDMNGLGVGDEIEVSVVYKQGTNPLMLSPTAPELTGLNPKFTFTAGADLDGLMSGQGTTITIEVTCNGVAKSKNLVVTKP